MKRYELKYCLDSDHVFALESILLSHPSGFSKHYPDRVINNIYFDSADFSGGRENLNGISDRTKVRYRWYGKSSTSDSGTLEFKIKENALGYKKYVHNISLEHLTKLTQDVNNELGSLQEFIPTIKNQYLRSYFIDTTRKFRLTIDRSISYQYPLDGVGSVLPYKDDRVIVEIKFDKSHYNELENISRYFPFRISKHSKYAVGLMVLYSR